MYMREQIRRAGPPRPQVLGIAEIAIKQRHGYRIVGRELEKKRAIGFGGDGRKESDLAMVYAFVGKDPPANIRLAVMEMWKPFRNSTQAQVPHADILFATFHVRQHLGDAVEQIRKSESGRLTGPHRKLIKGQK